jgi:hypothetical protein
MTQPEFTQALEQQLVQVGDPFTRAEVIAFVDDCWPLIDEDANPVLWAEPFWKWQADQTDPG